MYPGELGTLATSFHLESILRPLRIKVVQSFQNKILFRNLQNQTKTSSFVRNVKYFSLTKRLGFASVGTKFCF
jgi:hypothetical protein